MATFTWLPSTGTSDDKKLRVIKAQFGDGYAQRARDGLNTSLAKWTVEFNNRTTAEADAIEAFLEAQYGTTPFDWAPPNGTSHKFICDNWKRTEHSFNQVSISGVFEQVPM
jgi:phage-related protein